MDDQDIDLSGSGVTLIPDLDPTLTSTPSLMAVGGKQGNAYLLNRVNMAGALDRRPACNRDNPTANPPDTSLWDPNATYSWYGNQPGPLNVFGPYLERDSMGNQAKARSTPSYFRGADGTSYLFFTGATKNPTDLTTPMPPCVARIRIDTPDPALPAFFSVDATENTLAFKSPGTPVVSSNGSGPEANTTIRSSAAERYSSGLTASLPLASPRKFRFNVVSARRLHASSRPCREPERRRAGGSSALAA